MRARTIGGVLAATALLATACGGDDNGDGGGDAATDEGASFSTIEEGVLTVCTDAPYEPFEFEDSEAPSGYAGFDIDLLQEIADRLGLTLEVTNTGFDPIQSGVAMNSGQCDLAAAAMTITEERAENINFTDPYYTADQSLLMKADAAVGSLDEFSGELGVQSNTTGEEYANEHAPEGTTITSHENPADLFTALDAGNIDGILQDLPVNERRAETDDSVEMVEVFETGEEYGFGAQAEGSQDLVEAVNETLAEMRDDSTYQEIFDRYFS